MIIWLASYPRSGNTFFRILLKNIYSIDTYSVYNDRLFEQLKGAAEVVGHKKLEMSYEDMSASEQIFFVKTHKFPSDNFPAIYLMRDGRDSLISYAHYIMSFNKKKTLRRNIKTLLGWNEYAEVLKQLILTSQEQHINWSENVKQWMHRESLTIPIKFEKLIENPLECVGAAMESLPMENQNLEISGKPPSFEELHAQWPEFFRQGKSGGWQTEMSQKLQNLFWKYHGDVMQEFGYKR